MNAELVIREDMRSQGVALRGEIAQLSGEPRSEMAELRSDLRTEMAELRTDLARWPLATTFTIVLSTLGTMVALVLLVNG